MNKRISDQDDRIAEQEVRLIEQESTIKQQDSTIKQQENTIAELRASQPSNLGRSTTAAIYVKKIRQLTERNNELENKCNSLESNDDSKGHSGYFSVPTCIF